MISKLTVLAAALSVNVCYACIGIAYADDALTVMSYGGTYQKSQQVYFDAFKEATGLAPVVESADDGTPKLKAMVDACNVTWDIVQGETPVIIENCNNGYLERIDWSRLDKSKLIPSAVQECGVGTIISASIIAYDAGKFPGKKPATVKDFWDLKTFPGKRGMRKKAITTLEFALYADGVAPSDIYKELRTEGGVDRAFKKLDEIKKDVVWWESSSSAPQLLGSGEVSMSIGWNGRITTAKREEGKNFVIIWDGQNYDGDFFAIPKGAPHLDLAYKFLELATTPKLQAAQQEFISYGPTLPATLDLLPKERLADLPTAPENLKTAIQNDSKFWAENGEELEQRFIAWLNAG